MQSYETRWDYSSSTFHDALLAVDGSSSEQVLEQSGRWTARQVRTALDLQPADKVLELGCGVGRIGRELAGHCAEWHGSDISANMLKVAGERLADHANVHLHKLERTAFANFADHSFDKVYSVAVLIHLDKEDVFLYLREIARVLKPSGIAYLETWNLASDVGWNRWMLEVEHWAHSDQQGRKDVSRNQFCHPEEFRLYLEHAGLQPITLFDQSAWIQAVATKGASAEALAAGRLRIAAQTEVIRHSDRWNELFGVIVDILAGRRDIHQVLTELEGQPDEESRLVYDHLQAQVV